MNYFEKLKPGLELLAVTLTCAGKHRSEIIADIKSRCNIDVTDRLSESDLEALTQYQDKNTRRLIDAVTDSNPEINLNERYRRILGWFIIGFGFVYLGAITFLPIPEANQRFADTAAGVVIGSMIPSVIGFWFDGVANKRRKEESEEEE